MNSKFMIVNGSSKSDEWTTPIDIFKKLDNEFGFDLDPCANESNALCNDFFSIEHDGLKQSWSGRRVFCNPPYSKIDNWVKKAFDESRNDNTVVVMLIPARVDTRWFHNFVYGRAEIRYIKGRLKFGGGTNNSAPFPSMIVIYRGPFA